MTASFVIRVLTYPKHDLLPKSILTSLETEAPAFWKWANVVVKEESVTYIWDEKKVVEGTKAIIAKLAAAK